MSSESSNALSSIFSNVLPSGIFVRDNTPDWPKVFRTETVWTDTCTGEHYPEDYKSQRSFYEKFKDAVFSVASMFPFPDPLWLAVRRNYYDGENRDYLHRLHHSVDALVTIVHPDGSVSTAMGLEYRAPVNAFMLGLPAGLHKDEKELSLFAAGTDENYQSDEMEVTAKLKEAFPKEWVDYVKTAMTEVHEELGLSHRNLKGKVYTYKDAEKPGFDPELGSVVIYGFVGPLPKDAGASNARQAKVCMTFHLPDSITELPDKAPGEKLQRILCPMDELQSRLVAYSRFACDQSEDPAGPQYDLEPQLLDVAMGSSGGYDFKGCLLFSKHPQSSE